MFFYPTNNTFKLNNTFLFFLFSFYMFYSLNYFIFKISPNKNSKNNLFKLNMFNWKW